MQIKSSNSGPIAIDSVDLTFVDVGVLGAGASSNQAFVVAGLNALDKIIGLNVPNTLVMSTGLIARADIATAPLGIEITITNASGGGLPTGNLLFTVYIAKAPVL